MTLPRRVNLALVVVTAVVLVGTLAVWLVRDDGARPSSGEEATLPREVAITKAVRSQAKAFMEIDYRNMDKLISQVESNSTGRFRKQYSNGAANLKAAATKGKAIAKPKILKIGLGQVGKDQATAFVAVNTRVQNTSSKGKWQDRPWRVKFDMVRKGERWLTADVQFVG